jgi:predicted SnoaL-like aldol condensation-catalyzing enzyme
MTSPTENKAVIRRFFAEIDAGNLASLDELVDEDYIDHHPPAFPGLPPGRAGLKRLFEIYQQWTPGVHEVLDQVAEGDLVLTRIRAHGPASLPDTGVVATAVHRVRDGKLVEHLGEHEYAARLTQIGVGAAS